MIVEDVQDILDKLLQSGRPSAESEMNVSDSAAFAEGGAAGAKSFWVAPRVALWKRNAV